MTTPASRARPMPPDERRAALVAATLPLVARHGAKVTTRQIAEAAGVAEGTIFRVFPDKDALVDAAICAALDPTPMLDELAAIDPAQPLRRRVVQATRILQDRLVSVISLMTTLGTHGPPERLKRHWHASQPTNERIYAAVGRLLEPDRDQFRCEVTEVARLLRMLTFSGSHPTISDGRMLDAEQIVSVILDGVRRHDDTSRPRGTAKC